MRVPHDRQGEAAVDKALLVWIVLFASLCAGFGPIYLYAGSTGREAPPDPSAGAIWSPLLTRP